MPHTKDTLQQFLNEIDVSTTTIEHPALFTVEDSKALRGEIDGGHTKNLFVKDKKGKLFLLVVEEDAQIDMKTVNKKLDCGRLSFGKPDLLMEKLGIIPGAVTAFSIINDSDNAVQIVFDEKLMQHEIINCHPLTNEATTSIARDDLLSFVKACGHEPLIMALQD